MLRNNRGEKEKDLRRMYKEYERLRDKWRETGQVVPLEEPYQQGWHRYFVLRDDAKNRDDSRYMQQALDLVNNQQYSHREDFKTKDYKTGKWLPLNQRLGHITEEKYETLNERIKKYFMKATWFVYTDYQRKTRKVVTGYVLREQFYYVLKIVPRMVTHQWIPDEEYETRMAEMQHYFQRAGLWPKIEKMMNWNHKNFYDRKENDKWVNRDMEGYEEDVA